MKTTKSFSTKDKVLLVVFSIVLLFVIYYFLVQVPLKNATEAAQSSIADYELLNPTLQAKFDKMTEMQNEIAEIKQSGSTKFVPEYDNQPKLVDFLRETLRSTISYSLDFTSNLTDENSNVLRRTLTINYDCGSYTEAKSIIKALENCDYSCSITDLIINVNTNEVIETDAISENPVSVSLSATFYERIV